jgi:serine/threonine protein phosphatase PrpC
MDLEYGSASDVGVVRELNEDSLLAAPKVFVVADGMGGHAAGEVASALAINRLRSLTGLAAVHSDDVVDALASANLDILAAVAQDRARTGMGTTVAGVGVVVVGGTEHWMVFNIGDSRVYRFAEGQLVQVSQDHSEVAELQAAGRITALEAAVHPLRNVVTRSLGTDPGPVADLWVFPPVAGERFLVCSDGLTLEVGDEQISDALASEQDPQAAAELLVRLAVDAGGRDNVTAVVVDVRACDDVLGAADDRTAPRARADL